MTRLYDEKVQTMKNVANHIDNGRVPLVDMAQTWSIAYGGGTLQQCVDDIDEEIRVYGKHLEDMYFDALFVFGLNRPLSVYKGLGFSSIFSADGVSIQYHTGKEAQVIRDDEISRFIADPVKFLKEVAIARRYPALMAEYPKDLEAMKNSLSALVGTKIRNEAKMKALIEKYETPPCHSLDTMLGSTLDTYMTYRGLKETFADMRRNPNLVKEACEAIMPFFFPIDETFNSFPWIGCPIAIVNYLSPKQFEEFVWPTVKPLFEMYISKGAKLGIATEGKWGQCLDYLQDMPKNSLALYIEEDDYFEIQKKMGDKVALAHPFSTHLVKTGTKKQVEDKAKEIINKIGGCGTFLALDRGPLVGSDINAENYAALGQICLNYKTK